MSLYPSSTRPGFRVLTCVVSCRYGYGKLNQRVRASQNHHLFFLQDKDMNPLTLVKRIQKLNSREADLGISESASWHAKYKESAYVFVGGIPYDLTEGDLLAVFAQYGEIVDVNLVRDKSTGKSKGFAFIAYEDQRSTNLAVDNFNGAQILGRIIRVDHVSHYKKKEEEDEETERQKREERGVCRAFQRGECTRGDSCKFSHDEQRAANTGWGHEEDRRSKWGHDKFEGHRRNDKQSSDILSNLDTKHRALERHKAGDHDSRRHDTREDWHKHSEDDSGRQDGRHRSSRPELREKTVHREDRDRKESNTKSTREDRSKEDYLGRKEEKRARRHAEHYDHRESQDRKVRNKDSERRSSRARDSSSVHVRNRDDEDPRESRDEKVRDRDSMRSYHASDSSSAHHRGRDDENYHRSRR